MLSCPLGRNLSTSQSDGERMTSAELLPRLLVIDDLFGRSVPASGNEERADLCRRFRLVDVTGDQPVSMPKTTFREVLAEAVFHRGQIPAAAGRGHAVENDLPSILSIVRAGSGWEAERRPWSLILLDLCFYTGNVTDESERQRGRGMPSGRPADEERYFGLEVLSTLTETFPDLPVAILSSMPRADVAREYIRRGAVGFLERGGADPETLLQDYVRQHGLIPDREAQVLGMSRVLLLSLRAARRAAGHARPVLIRGEKGTGKELFAKYVHRHRSGQLVAVNCGQFRDAGLAFSTLFGHRKGAFTGADRDREGAVVKARNGTLFLDEIASLGLEVQGGLHRLLQEGEVAPLGGEESPTRDVNVKLLAASNADLEGLGLRDPVQFMPDLLDRLKLGDSLFLPPLRERFEDLPWLVDRFVRQAEEESGQGTWKGRTVDISVFDHLRTYDWPGNVRELEGCIKRAVSTFKHMEALLPACIELPALARAPLRRETVLEVSRPPFSESPTISDPIAALTTIRFDDLSAAELSGRMAPILRVLGNYVEAVLRITAKPSAERPDGDLRLHPAAKWMTGDKKLTATAAADLIKRLLRPLEREGLLTPVLREALDRAFEIRKPGRDTERPRAGRNDDDA